MANSYFIFMEILKSLALLSHHHSLRFRTSVRSHHMRWLPSSSGCGCNVIPMCFDFFLLPTNTTLYKVHETMYHGCGLWNRSTSKLKFIPSGTICGPSFTTISFRFFPSANYSEKLLSYLEILLGVVE